MKPSVFLSERYRTYQSQNCSLKVRGDIFGYGTREFEGPEDPSALKVLFTAIQKDPVHSWSLIQGNCTCVWESPEKTGLYRTAFSPYLIFYSSNQVSDDLRNLLRVSYNFSSDYLLKFVLDCPSLQFNSILSPFAGVLRLPPHSVVTFGKDSSPSLKPLPWEPYVFTHTGAPFEESARAIRNQLEIVLRWHLQKKRPLQVELSGGLDSSFVASLLADLSSDPIKGHMYAFRQNPSHTFSEKCAQTVASEKKIALQIIDSADLASTDLSLRGPFQNEPVDFFWQGALFGRICQSLMAPHSQLFTGFGADQLFMRNQAAVKAISKKYGFKAALPWVTELAHSSNRSSLNFLYQYALGSLPRRVLVSLLDLTRNWRINPFKLDELMPELLAFENVSWLKGTDLIGIQEEGSFLEERFFEPFYPHPQMNYLVAPNYVLGPYLEEIGVEYIHPFCDPRMLDLAWRRIPFTWIHDFKNPYKQLLRAAMTGIVPETVRNRKRDEFSFDGYFYSLIKHNRDYLYSLLEFVLQETQDWIDPAAIRQSFALLFFGRSSNSEVKLARLLAYSHWKRGFLSWLSTPGKNSSC